MASLIVFLIIIGTVGLILLLAKISTKYFADKEDALGITTQNTKSGIHLIARTGLQVNLSIDTSNRGARFFGKLPLFRRPQTGDTEFDKLFLLTSWRDDVLDAVKANGPWRKALIELARAVPAFSSLNYSKERISLVLWKGSLSRDDAQESARQLLVAALPDLLAPFQKLPPDTARQGRARLIDAFAPYLPVLTLISLTLFGSGYDQPPASSELPWKYIVEAILGLTILHFAVLLCITRNGAARLQGLLVAAVFFAFSAFSLVPSLIDEINGLSSQEFVAETVQFAGLYEMKPQKGLSHHYIILEAPPQNLIVGNVTSAPSLEISSALYGALLNQHPQQSRPMKISEAQGLLGVAFVARAAPVSAN